MTANRAGYWLALNKGGTLMAWTRHRRFGFGGAIILTAALIVGPGILSVDGGEYAARSVGTQVLEKNGVIIKMLVDASNLGGMELDIAEITLPVAYGQGGGHHHGSMEIFYILSGTMGHTVNGVRHILTPGTIGIVRPEDTVAHSVESDEPVKALVIWVPAGESDRLVNELGYQARPID